MNECTFIILGATGDLAKRKLIPALYQLIHDKKIDRFMLVGVARDAVSATEFLARARAHITRIDEEVWSVLEKNSYYQAIDFQEENTNFEQLALFVQKMEKEHHLSGNRLVYLAVPSLLFGSITQALGVSGLVRKSGTNGMLDNNIWQRIVYEKPFGFDQATSREINTCINTYFDESQVYRIDHYLTKELVSSIVLVRFTNMLLEPLWNKNYIDEVQIIMNEVGTVEGRGLYYDRYGVLKDVVQNHMFQLLALIAMDLPQELQAQYIQKQKADILKKIFCEDALLGQYQHYTQENNVAPSSQTPTFAALKMMIDTPSWQGVPFYLKTGKGLEKKNSSIHIKFKEVPCRLRKHCIYSSNYLTIEIEPYSRFSIQLNTKQVGHPYEVTPVTFGFNHDYAFGGSTPEAYETLIEQIMSDDRSVSVSIDEIDYSWHALEKIELRQFPVYSYTIASNGPLELQEFNKRNGIQWRA